MQSTQQVLNMKFWGQKTFLMVSGASKGMGKKCAIEFCKKIGPGSVAIISGRTLPSLEIVKSTILGNQKDTNFKLALFAQNSEAPDGKILERKIREFLALNIAKTSDFEHAIVVHGGMTQFNLKTKALSLQSSEDLCRFFTLNAFAPAILNSYFMKIFQNEKKMMRTIVNITSDAAIRPYNSLTTFHAASIAREAFMCCVAKENNGILVLNYNPGLLDIYIKSFEQSDDQEAIDYCKKMKLDGKITTCDKTVQKLIQILDQRQFFSGEHVDYFDLK